MTALFNIRLIACGFVAQGMYRLKHSRFEPDGLVLCVSRIIQGAKNT